MSIETKLQEAYTMSKEAAALDMARLWGHRFKDLPGMARKAPWADKLLGRVRNATKSGLNRAPASVRAEGRKLLKSKYADPSVFIPKDVQEALERMIHDRGQLANTLKAGHKNGVFSQQGLKNTLDQAKTVEMLKGFF